MGGERGMRGDERGDKEDRGGVCVRRKKPGNVCFYLHLYLIRREREREIALKKSTERNEEGDDEKKER